MDEVVKRLKDLRDSGVMDGRRPARLQLRCDLAPSFGHKVLSHQDEHTVTRGAALAATQ